MGQAAAWTRAAQYLRMSTERQNYSLPYQSAVNAAYAAEHGYEIIRTYSDAGISGLGLAKREGLKTLLADVLDGSADYEVVLVYDVSRWGRFQDPDESAHYEFLCRAAGVRIEYAAEGFPNDGAMASTLVKQLKRAMAAEYSRELSEKVALAKRGLAQNGFWGGGVCIYGFRRCVMGPGGGPGLILEHGQRKALQGQRVKLVAGPPDEVATVRRIFRDYAVGGLGTGAIAEQLNTDGVAAAPGSTWSRTRITRLLRNPKYVGLVIANRRRSRLGRWSRPPESSWVRVPGGCPALVERWLWDLAQLNLNRRLDADGIPCERLSPWQRMDDEAVVAELVGLLRAHGKLSARILRNAGRSPWVLIQRFGSLSAAYALAGYGPGPRQEAALQRNRLRRAGRAPWAVSTSELEVRLRALYARAGRLTANLIDQAPDLPTTSVLRPRLGNMLQLCALVGCEPTARQRRASQQAQDRRLRKAEALSRSDWTPLFGSPLTGPRPAS